MPELPYAPEALAPKMSKETFDYHYGKHLQTYVNNLNNLIAGTPYEWMPLDETVRKADGDIFHNAAQAWNHTFFFRMLTPAQQPMPAKLAAKLTEAFGSVEAFKEQFTKAAVGLFGSGWAWLAMDKAGKLSIVAKPNAGNPMTDGLRPVMTVDVWEHAYYIDYRNRRPDFLAAARPEVAIPLYERFVELCREKGFPTETGEFGAYMQVDSLNYGPLTIILDTDTL